MDKIKFRQFKSFLTSQPFFIWHRLEQGDSFEDTDWEANDFWSVEETTEEVESQGQVIARTFSLFDKELNKILVEENKTIAISGDLESRIKQTNDNIDSGATLLNPVFEYRGATAEPFAFDTKNGVVININYSKRTRRKDFIKAYWDISIIKEVTEVKKYYFYLPEDKIYEKGEISLIKTERLHPQKSAQSLDSVFKRTGKLKSLDVMKVVENKILQNEVVFPAIDGAIDFIEESRDAKLSNNLIHDNTAWGTNPQWNELLEEIGHPHAGISGNIFRKKEIAEEDYKDAPIWTQISKLDKAIINDKMLVDKVIKDIVNSDKVIWYDFEGFSLPFAPLDNVSPYGQLVFQVSVIETQDNKETRIENLVVDPKTMSLDDLFDIVKAVYSDKAGCYVVYNKGYENTRIKEIVKLLRLADDKRTSEAFDMYEWIVANTVDLYDLFVIGSKNANPPVLLNDQLGKASIKNVEKHITKNKIKVPRPMTPYKDLDVKNGGMAMNIAIERSLGIIGDGEWKLKEEMLKKYCENDVRAMIVVYDFVIMLLENN